jgi:hypothetical protein
MARWNPKPQHQVATYLPIDEAITLGEHARSRKMPVARFVREVLREAGVLEPLETKVA